MEQISPFMHNAEVTNLPWTLTPADRSWHTWAGPLCCSAGGTCSRTSDSGSPETAASGKSHRRPEWRRSFAPVESPNNTYSHYKESECFQKTIYITVKVDEKELNMSSMCLGEFKMSKIKNRPHQCGLTSSFFVVSDLF